MSNSRTSIWCTWVTTKNCERNRLSSNKTSRRQWLRTTASQVRSTNSPTRRSPSANCSTPRKTLHARFRGSRLRMICRSKCSRMRPCWRFSRTIWLTSKPTRAASSNTTWFYWWRTRMLWIGCGTRHPTRAKTASPSAPWSPPWTPCRSKWRTSLRPSTRTSANAHSK